MNQTYTIDADRLIEAIGIERAEQVVNCLGISLETARPTIERSAEWRCGVEHIWWSIEAKQLQITDIYAVRWTETDEAGISGIEIVSPTGDEGQDGDDLREWLHAIAANVGSCDGSVR